VAAELEQFFSPGAIALVGASRDPQKLGYVLLDNLLRGRFPGSIFAVNPRTESVLGVEAFPSLEAIPHIVDLAIVVVPRDAVASIIQACGRKGVRAAVVITAGYRETGPEGLAQEEELIRCAREAGVRLVGPNSVGIINTFAGLNATFAETPPLQFEIALMSQSGAVATAVLDWARTTGVGFSKFVSLGNMADLDECDLLEYLADDPQTRLIVGYLEGFTDARRFLGIARRTTMTKPLVCMKVGRSAAGARAAASHTGSLAAADAVVDGAFKQAGVVRAYTMDELFDYTLAFAYLPLPQGRRIAVVTNAGGPGVMTADAIERYGLELARLTSASLERLAAGLPSAAARANPVDVLGDAPADRYRLALEVVLADEQVDGAIVMLTPQAVTEPERTARVVAHMARTSDKPVMAVYMGGDAVARGRIMLDQAHVPAYFYPERAVRAMAALARYHQYRRDMNDLD
jgi:acetyltransferase